MSNKKKASIRISHEKCRDQNELARLTKIIGFFKKLILKSINF